MGAETVYFADDIAKSSQYAVSRGNNSGPDIAWLQHVFGEENAEELKSKNLCFVFLFRVTLGKGFFLNGHHFSGRDFEDFLANEWKAEKNVDAAAMYYPGFDYKAAYQRAGKEGTPLPGDGTWVYIVRSKYFNFFFDLAECQNIRKYSKSQNNLSIENIKISAVPTPIFTVKAAFSAFFEIYQKHVAE